jgi:hypothetical protein
MIAERMVQGFVDLVVLIMSDLLLPTMLVMFGGAVLMRALIYFTIARESWFAREFEKRVHRFVDDAEVDSRQSFFAMTKRLLEKTYYELFEIRAIMKRRRPDLIGPVIDRVFLIQHGSAFLVKDTLKQIRYLKHGGEHPKLLEISKSVYQNNPCFSKVFGILPTSLFNDVLNILPGLFIVGGIFGTFLGIMKALPELGGMDLNDVESTKTIMDGFLLRVSFSMRTSIIGILLSVVMSLVNTVMSGDKLFIGIVDRFENALDILWTRSTSNDLTLGNIEFNEHKDPMEALAEQAIESELSTKTKSAA